MSEEKRPMLSGTNLVIPVALLLALVGAALAYGGLQSKVTSIENALRATDAVARAASDKTIALDTQYGQIILTLSEIKESIKTLQPKAR